MATHSINMSDSIKSETVTQMEMKLLSRETIKPSSPTPPHLKIYPLSFIDNYYFCHYVPIVFFYKPDEGSDQNLKISQLRRSLSQVLSKYYSFAGRLKDKITIECNDQGVSFLVTKIKSKLSKILQYPTDIFLNPLFADELQWKDIDCSGALIAVQINCFACGGMAISICMSHKLGDASTLINFMNDWTVINRKLEDEEEEGGLLMLPFPLLDSGALIFPQSNLPILPELMHVSENINVMCKRFIFQPSMIKFIKEMVTSSSMHSPTRVLVVTAWIYKHVVSINGLNFKTAWLNMAVNLRKRMVPPLSEKCVGNIIWSLSMVSDKKEIELKDLVCKIKEELFKFCDVYPKIFREKEKDGLSLIYEGLKQANKLNSDNHKVINFTSWCKFPIYEADFGWGKPTWVTTIGCPWKNIIILMDTRDGNGIEAIVNMEENHMAKFEHEVELLQYASLNSSNVGYDA